jgi:hypothetical protein
MNSRQGVRLPLRKARPQSLVTRESAQRAPWIIVEQGPRQLRVADLDTWSEAPADVRWMSGGRPCNPERSAWRDLRSCCPSIPVFPDRAVRWPGSRGEVALRLRSIIQFDSSTRSPPFVVRCNLKDGAPESIGRTRALRVHRLCPFSFPRRLPQGNETSRVGEHSEPASNPPCAVEGPRHQRGLSLSVSRILLA